MNKSKYIAGWEINFNDPEQFKKILLTQGIDEESFKIFSTLQTVTELFIDDNKVYKTIQHSYGMSDVENVNCTLPITEWKDRRLFYLQKDNEGNHSIGGRKPDEFILPNDANVKFIYLGTLDGSDEYFTWLGIEKLNLCYPIFEGFFELYLDYTEPNRPKLLNPEEINENRIELDSTGFEKLYYTETKFKKVNNVNMDNLQAKPENFLLCGVPLWYQYPEIPTCPKTGKLMNYVTTLNSDREINLENRDEIENPPYEKYLIFGDYGNLFIFYQPDSKILYLKMQF
ncbi:hypothetical protein NUH30_19370 [Leptospira sp. 85282-16]|uniref:hypothetical protein n=1 Tax=Leptospira sp. 85282-16 TaxID=2971256 RepID=UPI0021C1437D|nr:hypothetical protein [Leptospira sp. 85282-16]MCT8335856.1 hypothetical protein [Leptospira sp. 85282-16]